MIYIFTPAQLFAQDYNKQDAENTILGKIISIEKTAVVQSALSDKSETTVQYLKVVLNDGKNDKTITVENDRQILTPGDEIYLRKVSSQDNKDIYDIMEIKRTNGILIILAIFAILLILFAGKQGVRSLLALVASIAIILFWFIPTVLSGTNPITASIAVASVILFMALFFTHGFNRGSAIAYGGTILAVFVTGIFAYFAIHLAHLTGLSSDESTYLSIATNGKIDFIGLLFGAIIIGSLGALDDIAVTQVAVVRELYIADKKATFKKVYESAMRVGKEHVSALVNTLVLAYTGASLSLLLLYYKIQDGVPFIDIEIFATEIVRMIVGSIGLILVVPITTVLAAKFLKGKVTDRDYDPSTHHAHHH
jgi:uncharacterized membrane protein